MEGAPQEEAPPLRSLPPSSAPLQVPEPVLSLDSRRLQALYSVSRAITALLPLDQLWEYFYQEVIKVIPGDAFSISIYDEASDTAQSLFSVDTVNGQTVREGQGEPYSIKGRFLEKIVRSRRGELILRHEDTLQDLGLVRFGDTSRLSMSLLFAPMVSGDKVLGALTVQSYTPDAYCAEDLLLLEAIAASAALALQNARLYSSLAEQKDQLAHAHARLHEAHHRLQEELIRMRRALDDMRWALPEPEGWEFARHERTAEEVGGDYSLFWEDPERGTVSFVVADASGHGPSAAMFMAMTHVEAVSALRRGLEPAGVLSEVNVHLSQALPPTGFVTMACGQLVRATGEMRLALGGHPRVLMWRHKDRRAEFWDMPQGPALGLYEDAVFPEARGQLAPGDKILVYTDGLLETCNRQDCEFGEESIRRVLQSHGEEPPARILDIIDQAAQNWRGAPIPQDDCLMVMLSRKNSLP
ncbi:MAG: hypothetical protein Kow0059_06300 [Candidatus Sumerlaeia bacterium]